jgi:hypothetical protein
MLDEIKIMQFADGTLDPSEREIVKKEIESNSKYKQILDDYIYTGEILNNLGKEIKSKPLPTYLSNEIFEFNKNKVQLTKKKQFSFNFFDIFKIKYSAVAAGFALFFVGGYTTSHYLIADKTDYGNMQEVKGTIDNQPIFRGAKKNIETVLDSSAEFYQIFNIEKFNKEINAKIKNTKNNQKLKIQFSNNNAIELVVGNNFKNNKDQNCKNLNLQKKIKITEINEPVNASISICSQNNEWKFVSINLN